MRLRDKIAIVTGGGRGIGRAISLGLAREGARVGIVWVAHEEAAEQAVNEILETGGNAMAVRGDVADRPSIQHAIERVTAAYGGLDIAVHCAGVLTRRPFMDLTDEDWTTVHDVALRGSFLVGQLASQVMLSHRSGSITFIASINSFVAAPALAHYNAAKAGIVQLARTMAHEMAADGIRVNSISPGLIRTDINAAYLADEGVRRSRERRIPLGRLGRPEDIAGAVIYLSSDEGQWVTGTNLVIDGGESTY